VISGSPDPDAIVRALDQGADDYITRPFSGTEFVVRIRAAVRRALRARKTPEQNLVVQTGDLVIDREARIVTKCGTVVHLTPTEFRLLEALSIRVGKVAPHRFLLSTVWGDEFINDTHYLRIYVGYLRQKLEDDPARPEYLLNEWGTGYRLAAFPPAATGALSGAASQRWDSPRPLAIDGSNHHHEEVDELPAIRTAGARWAG
jgi:two-component system, OmpR family, KDP operon response regulator KdpE